VVLDNDRGTRESVEHLLRWVEPDRLYFVGGQRGNFDTIQRAKSFTDALTQLGITPSPEQVTFGDYSLDWGKEWGIRMNRHKKLDGAAILAANDKIACGIMQAAGDAALRVPDQVRIVGFNDSYESPLIFGRVWRVSGCARLGVVA